MNHIYKLKFSKRLGQLIAVSEIAKGSEHKSGVNDTNNTESSSLRSLFKLSILAASIGLFSVTQVQANTVAGVIGIKSDGSVGAVDVTVSGRGISTYINRTQPDGVRTVSLTNTKNPGGIDESVIIGADAKVIGKQGVAVGYLSGANAQGTAVGTNVYASGESSIAIGNDDISSVYRDKLPVGTVRRLYGNIYRGDHPFLTEGKFDQTYVNGSGSNSKLIYSPTAATGAGSIAIGSRSLAYANGSTSVGTLSFALADGSTAIGLRSFVDEHANSATAMGEEARAFASNTISIGNKSETGNKGANAYGYNARAIGVGSIAIGQSVAANAKLQNRSQNRFISALKNVSASGNTKGFFNRLGASPSQNGIDFEYQTGKDIVIETDTTQVKKTLKQNDHSVGIGYYVISNGENSIGVGSAVGALGDNSVAIGSLSYVDKQASNAVALGTNAVVNNASGMALGDQASVTLDNSVALGYLSKTDYSVEDLQSPAWVARGSYSIPSSTRVGVISVGKKGYERRIVNVAPGYRDTDAVNISQLKSLQDRLDFSNADNANRAIHYVSIDTLNQGGLGKELADLERKENAFKEYINLKSQLLTVDARRIESNGSIDEEKVKPLKDRVASLEKDAMIANLVNNSNLKKLSFNNQNGQFNFDKAIADIESARDKDENTGALTAQEKQKLTQYNYNNQGAKGKDSIAIGYNASTAAGSTNSVAIGANSNASLNYDRIKNISGYDVSTNRESAETSSTWRPTAGEFSIGNDDSTRRITHVAAGASDTDAVNVAQLKKVTAAASANSLGSFTVSSSTDTTTSDKIVVDKNNPNLVISGKNGELVSTVSTTDRKVELSLDPSLKKKVDNALSKDDVNDKAKLSYKANGQNSQNVTLSTGLDFTNGKNTTASVAKDGVVKFDLNNTLTGISSISNKAGNAGTIVTIADNGISLNNKTITGVAASDITKDGNAVATTGQLYNLENKQINFVANEGSVARKLGDTLNIKGTKDYIITNVSGDTLSISLDKKAKDAIDKVDSLGDKSIMTTFEINDGNESNKTVVENGTKLSITGKQDEIQTTVTNNKVEVGLAEAYKNKIDNAVSKDNVNDTATLSYKANGENPQNVTLSKGLDFTNGKNTTTSVAKDGVVKVDLNDTLTGIKSVSITEGPTLSSTGIAMNGKKITGLANGTEDLDAVNISQLKGALATLGGTVDGDTAATIGSDGSVTQPKYNLKAGEDKASPKTGVGSALHALDSAISTLKIAQAGTEITYKANGKNAHSVALNDGLNFTSASDLNITSKEGGEVAFELSDTVKKS
ncbi:ESPR-type extended signal peptide-containing protein, partial [Otariodibacter oris]